MSATIVYAYDAHHVNMPPVFAIVADETHMEYVLPPGRSTSQLDSRAKMMAKQHAEKAKTTLDWVRVGASNFNYMRFTEPTTTVRTFDEARAHAEKFLSDTEEQGT